MTNQLEARLNATFEPQPKEHNGTIEFETEEFYMVYVEGNGSPMIRHEYLDEARKEAERLAEKEGKPTYLLTATHACLPLASKLDILNLVEKAIDLDQHDIAKALLTCSILVDAAAEYIPKEGLISKMWFKSAATLKH